MNETIRIRFSRDSGLLRVESFDKDGLVLDGETSAPPRGFSLAVKPANAIMEYRLRRVRQVRGWNSAEFHLNVSGDGEGLTVRGVDEAALPAGRYGVTVRVADLVLPQEPAMVDIPEGGSADLTLPAKPDARRVELTAPVAEFDDRMRRVVTDPASRLDGMAVADWLAGDRPRARRKACLLNLLAKLRAAPGSAVRSKLIDNVSSVFYCDVDRVYGTVGAAFLADLQALAANPAKPFYFEGKPASATHRRLLDRVAQLEGDANPFELLSFRQEGRASMQAVVAVPTGGAAGRKYYADLDIDLGNPLQDAAGFVIHMGELLSPSQTDHLALAKKLSTGPTGDFLYYRVTSAQVQSASS